MVQRELTQQQLMHIQLVCTQNMRLLAAVVAKNGVGSSWRKTIGSREWSRVPPAEKEFVRSTVLELLFGEPRERVAIQLGLLIANMAKSVCVCCVQYCIVPWSTQV